MILVLLIRMPNKMWTAAKKFDEQFHSPHILIRNAIEKARGGVMCKFDEVR